MPYSGKDDPNIPDNVPDGKKAQWVEVWNSAYKKCIADGGKTKECETSAFAQANGVISNSWHPKPQVSFITLEDILGADLRDGGEPLQGDRETAGKSSVKPPPEFPVSNGEEKVMPEEKKSKLVALREAFALMGQRISDLFDAPTPLERALSMPDLYEQVWSGLDDMAMSGGDWMWLTDVYYEDNKLYAIVAGNGKLYRSDLTVDNSSVSLGDMQEVMHEFVPVSNAKSQMTIRRQADGQLRIFLISGTTVLNRNGEIDSTELFDNLKRRADESQKYPYIGFYHLGKSFNMGTYDFLERDGVVALASGILDDTPLAQAMARAYEASPETWGSSISFWPIGEPEMWEVVPGIKLPVYTDGEYEEISILPEKDACALFTTMRAGQEVKVMEKRVADALKLLAGDDETLLNDLMSRVDTVNRSVEEEGLIHREAEVVEDGAEPPAETETTEPVVEPVLEMDDETVGLIVQQILDSAAFKDMIAVAQSASHILDEKTKQYESEITEMRAANIHQVKKLEERIEELEKGDDAKKREWINDLPARASRQVTYRPRTANIPKEESDPSKRSLQEAAEETLANLK